MIKTVIFDFDGVLAESVEIKTAAFARLFEPEGPEAVKAIVAYHRDNGGVSRFEKIRYMYRDVLKQPLSEEQFDSLCEKFQELVLEGVIKATEVKGATDCLNSLFGRVILFIVSGTPQDEIREIISARAMGHYFKGVYGAPTSKTDMVATILKNHGLQPGEVLVIGDSITDYNAAYDTGTGFIARTTSDMDARWEELGIRTVKDLSGCLSKLGL